MKLVDKEIMKYTNPTNIVAFNELHHKIRDLVTEYMSKTVCQKVDWRIHVEIDIKMHEMLKVDRDYRRPKIHWPQVHTEDI